jgi:hypothetical protein
VSTDDRWAADNAAAQAAVARVHSLEEQAAARWQRGLPAGTIQGGCPCGFWSRRNCAYVRATGVCHAGAARRVPSPVMSRETHEECTPEQCRSEWITCPAKIEARLREVTAEELASVMLRPADEAEQWLQALRIAAVRRERDGKPAGDAPTVWAKIVAHLAQQQAQGPVRERPDMTAIGDAVDRAMQDELAKRWTYDLPIELRLALTRAVVDRLQGAGMLNHIRPWEDPPAP